MTFTKQLAIILICLIPASSLIASESNTYNRVSFNVTEQKQVNNDEIMISMAVERDQQDATILSDEINLALKSANEIIHSYPTIKSSTSDYSIRPVYTRDKKLEHWHGTASIVLISQNKKDIAALVQKLQKQLIIKSTRYSVSAERKESIQNGMIKGALKKFNTQAALISSNMGFSSYKLVNLNINHSGNSPRPLYAMASKSAMVADIAPPSFEPGTSTIKVTISGTIEMDFATE